MSPEDNDRVATGYSMWATWCLRCDVGWTHRYEPCWMCGQDDERYAYNFVGKGPAFVRC